MSNGDSLDGFVFPPFIPPAAAARPADPPAPAAPQPPAARDEPPAAPQSASGRMTMPWDVETPIVSEPADAPAVAADEAEDEDLPWLERPEPREPVAEAPAVEAAPPQDEAFPDWLAWDDRATDEVRSETEAVAPVEGLEDFAPVDDLAGFVAPEPAAEWAEAAPPASVVDDASGYVAPPAWSLDEPEAAELPPVAQAEPEVTFESPAAAAAAEPAFEVTLDDGALTFAPAEAAAEPADAPALPADPFIADTEAVLSAEPDPFTAAAVTEAEDAAPAEAAAASSAASPASGVFAEVAGRLEDIARTLRDRPDDLLSGAASDPLALLVAGYVMGYSARR
jgi:hypothetical protein